MTIITDESVYSLAERLLVDDQRGSIRFATKFTTKQFVHHSHFGT
jgi:hypothetical protein